MRKYQIAFVTTDRVKLAPVHPNHGSGVSEMLARQRADVHDLADIEAKMAELGVRRIETPRDQKVADILERLQGFRSDAVITFEADTEEQAVLIKMFLNTEAPIWLETGQ